MLAFSTRNRKEILRDPLNVAFGVGLPLVVLLLLTAIQSNVPVDLFRIDTLTPGIAVFGLSFIALFAGILIAKDRGSSFLMRLFASPLTASDYIAGYTLPMLPVALLQIAVCFLAAILLGLRVSPNILLAILVLMPAAALYLGIGLLAGTLLNDKAVGGVCGALLTNLTAWLSGAWFDLSLVGGAFERIAYLLPFVHAVEAGKAALAGDYSAIMPHLWWVIGYAALFLLAAVLAFRSKMNGERA